jgi:hypothetical protein
MMSDPSQLLDQHLLTAYRTTTYRVAAPGRTLRLRIDQHDAQLARLLQAAGVDCAAVLSAWNPGSQQQSRSENALRQRALLQDLAAAGFRCLPGTNLPDHRREGGEDWTEESVLVLNLALPAAHELAGRYGQHAFLWIDRYAAPRLIVTAARGTIAGGR